MTDDAPGFIDPEDGRPLAGLRVLDLAAGTMGAIARTYAELGADVIRLEPAGPSPDRGAGPMCAGVHIEYVAANLCKRIAPRDRLEALAQDADIVIAQRGTIDVAAVRSINPTMVVLSVSDFGDTGRFAGWTGSGAVYHALSGELSRSGAPGRAPLLPPDEIATNCAAMQAAFVTLVAYWQALKTGQGDHLDFSALDGVTQALDPGFGVSGSAAGGVVASRLPRGRTDAGFMYPILKCRDGYIRLCVLNPRHWQGMFAWMGRPAEFSDPSFDKVHVRFGSKTLMPAMARHFADLSRAEAEEEAARFGVPAAPVLELEDAMATEQFVARQAFRPVEIAPGISAPFPNGVLEIDRKRMGHTGIAPAAPEEAIDWNPRAPLPRPDDTGARPFAGLRILDFGVIVVGAETGRLLGDQGADVIKVESSQFVDGGRQSRHDGPISPAFATGHRNKRGLGLNLRSPQGKDLLYRLVRDTDIVLSNFKGGTLESLGLDHATLKTINPRIIVVDSSAFGPSGPWARRMGYGPLVRASTGLTMQWRYPGEPDSFSDAMTVYPDHVAGRIGAIGAIALLIRRLRTGRGGQVSISQAEVMLSHIGPQVAIAALEKAGHAVTGEPPVSTVHACAGDDEWCVVTVRDDEDRQAIADATDGEPLDDWMARHGPREAMEALQAAGVAAAAMLRVVELPTLDYYVARDFFRQTQHPHIVEPMIMENAPVRSERLPDPADAPAPLLAEHTIALLGERLGLTPGRVAELVASGAVEQYGMTPQGEAARPPASPAATRLS